MEKDAHISKWMKEGGLQKAPKDLSRKVMERLAGQEAVKPYTPIIGRRGMVFIFLAVLAIAVLALLLAEPAQAEPAGWLRDLGWKGLQLHSPEWKLPQPGLNMEFLSRLHPSTGVAAALVALFLLVLGDAGLGRKRRRPGLG